MRFLFILGTAIWFVVGDPPKTVAHIFWSGQAAPWETKDEYHRRVFTVRQSQSFANTSLGCRDWAYYANGASMATGSEFMPVFRNHRPLLCSIASRSSRPSPHAASDPVSWLSWKR